MSVVGSGSGPGVDQVRLMGVASRLYHVHGLRQRDIASRLGLSQARVSRVLAQAEAHGIVRTVVAVPDGIAAELEEAVESAFGLPAVHVVDTDPLDGDLAPVLGRAAGRYFSEVTPAGEVVGYTSWSRTLQEMAHVLAPTTRPRTRHVVAMLGDLGSPRLQHAADRATQAMARSLGAEPVYLRTPGVVPEAAVAAAAHRDAHVRRALDLLDRVDVAFVGLGPADVHGQLEAGDSYFTPPQLAAARSAGAVGQLNQRFLDARGQPVVTALDELVVGITLEQVRAAGRRVVVAGGTDKHAAVAAALRGGWVDVLVTDAGTARSLLPGDPHA